MKFAAKIDSLKVETAFEMMAKAKKLEAEGKKIIHLEIGEPDFDTPKNIKEAAKKALDDGKTHYGPSAGLPEHRKAIAEYYSKQIGVQYGPENVVVTPGAKPIMSFAITALLEGGRRVPGAGPRLSHLPVHGQVQRRGAGAAAAAGSQRFPAGRQ